MGALLGVAQGSVEPPRMIVITYTPATPRAALPCSALSAKPLPSTPAASPLSLPKAWKK